ncbi:MAG: hypothetical protein ACFFE2_14720, partial [Candidatus Thorarchaeota archaeon]
MKLTLKQLTSLVLLSSILLLGVGTNAAIALDGVYSPSQIVSPFTEMQPGVYVAWEWWNETGSEQYEDYGFTSPGYDPGYISNDTDANPSGSNDYYYWEYVVEDIFGNNYTITETSRYNWTSDWEFSNLLVVILLDPDASYMAWMARQP